ncbi:MAG: flavodoxin family protein [Spirochaetales bacterium]|nr:flavodoxin family protein [Spirochaetales bacterium]
MNVLVLEASPGEVGGFKERMDSLTDHLTVKGHTILRYDLTSLDLHYCTGCFTCWWKTPGRCMYKDDMEVLYPEILKSDLLLFASPLVMGLPSYLIKECQDRLIPLLHPYITLINGECHHRKRYDRYPDIALITRKEKDTEKEDIELLRHLHRRLALNFHSTFRGVGFTDMTNEEICHETCCA